MLELTYPISLFLDRFEYFFSLWLGNLMGIQNPILYFPQMTVRTTQIQFRFRTDLNIFFPFELEIWFDGDSKSDIVLHLKWFTGPQKFGIMIRCKINFDIIWYTVIFASNLYLSIFVWSSDILNFVFVNVVILVFI